MQKVVLYSKPNCPLCDEAKELLIAFQDQYNYELKVVDIYSDDELLEKYQLMIPVVEIDGRQADYGQIEGANVSGFLK
ncbi:glutaredoxin family protein [Sediminibacillus halophilus]|uniref:Glutaredoxin n=1 Tax=Sediminibacillus halophilus TaxID=482461 RepID=A0A1G9R432_9BACI|nr:glutaredoxin family protein [Sediminibacillus halophilus]SDM17880.1 Glutaredoxin [Sediminibacillus halophilus]